MTSAPSAAMDKDIRFAIANTRLLRLRYTGRDRVVEPHDYGRQGDAVRLFVYQLREEDDTAKTGWRLLDVDSIEACTVLDEEFPGSRGAAYDTHRPWDEVFARVR